MTSAAIFIARAFSRPGALDRRWAEDITRAFRSAGLSYEVPEPQAGVEEETWDIFARGSCPPYEAAYTAPGAGHAAEMADVAGFYRAFGLAVAPGERPDHIAAELEFYAFLQAREEAARARGEADGADVCLDARRKFLRDHLGRWLPLFAARLRQEGGTFHARLADIAGELTSAEAKALGVELKTAAPPSSGPEPECFNCPGVPNLRSLPTEPSQNSPGEE